MEIATIRLTCKNNENSVNFDRSVLKRASKVVEKVLIDDPEAEEIPVHTATDIGTLLCIKDYLQSRKEPFLQQGQEFPEVTNPVFMEVLRVANYLEIDSIIDHCTRLILQEVQGKSAVEIQGMFGVQISEADKEEAQKILEEE